MALMGSLQLGKNALLSYQGALQVIGNNVANAGVNGYARLSPRLSSLPGVVMPEGLMPGGGVGLTALQRHLDEALEARLRAAIGQERSALAQQQALSAIESLYGELSDNDLSTAFSAFFNAFEDVQNTPQDIPTRSVAISAGQTLAQQMQRMRASLTNMHDQLNSRIVEATRQANYLASQVADLNLQIVRAESTGQGAAAALRDQRDGVLKELAGLMDIQTVETPEGAVNVYIGNEPLVQYGQSRGLSAVAEEAGDRTLVTVRFADNNGPVRITSGEIAGLVASRDEDLYGQIQKLDQLAAVVIREVNRIHSQGQGLSGFTAITGSYAVLDPDAALDSAAAGLPFPTANGSFKILVRTEGSDAVREYLIPVTPGMSLNDLVSAISAQVPGVTATVTSDNRLQMVAAGSNTTIGFAEDSSGAMAALGINVFFTGASAADIAVEAGLADHPEWLAAAGNSTPGDGSNAGRISALARGKVDSLGTSIPEQWQSIVGRLAVRSATAIHAGEATHSVSQSLQSQREAVSGVNMDEEAVNLMRYQRSFQAAARYITLVDELVSEMLSMVR